MLISKSQNISQSECSICHFLVFHNLFMMLFHILMSVLDHELVLDIFTSSVILETIHKHLEDIVEHVPMIEYLEGRRERTQLVDMF